MERIPTSLDYLHLGSLANWLNQNLAFAQLQEVWTNGRDLILSFYNRQEFYFRIDTNVSAPKVGIFLQRPGVEKKNKPLSLFLNSHAKNLRLEKTEVFWEWGRVLKLHLIGGERRVEIEIILIPRAFNLIASVFLSGALKKKISWEKPRELPPSIANPGARNFPDLDWIVVSKTLFGSPSRSPAVDNQMPAEKADSQKPGNANLEKKRGVLAKLEANFSKMESRSWRELGEFLKVNLELSQVPDELKSLIDKKISVKENREKAFATYKQIEEKKKRIQERIFELKKEIEALEAVDEDSASAGHSEKSSQAPVSKGLLERAGAQGRRLEISPQLFAVIGKSGKDNLSILRRAQPWDLWIHLKDFPGAHAIISRPRQMDIGQGIIDKVARWVIKESFNSKKISLAEVFEVLVVETRFVKPIKGDKLGRVTYQNPSVYRVRLRE